MIAESNQHPATGVNSFHVTAQRDHWIRLFNRLEAAISHHKAANPWRDTYDDALYAARDRILRDAGRRAGDDPVIEAYARLIEIEEARQAIRRQLGERITEELATSDLSLRDIAARMGRSHEYVRKLASLAES